MNVTIADSPLRRLLKEIYFHKDDLADRKSDTIQILHKSDRSIVFPLPEQPYPILFATGHQAYFDTYSSSIPDLVFSNIFKIKYEDESLIRPLFSWIPKLFRKLKNLITARSILPVYQMK